MTTSNPTIDQLRKTLKQALELDLEEYGLMEQSSGEFNSTFLGVHLKSAFQPIYDSTVGELHGHEGLLRPSLGGSLSSSPDFAFTYASEAGKLVQFDRVSRTLHVLNFKQLYDEQGLLFLNVHPKLLIEVTSHGKVFEHILHAHSVPTHRVVIEIHEGLIDQDRPLIEAIENYRERGYQIAIDHFGGRHSHLQRLWKLNLDYVKFDLTLIQEAESDTRVRSVLPGLIKSVVDVGMRPVVTGIETAAQLDIALASGAQLLQGFYLGEPANASAIQRKKIDWSTPVRLVS